jgi:hypothetical protein
MARKYSKSGLNNAKAVQQKRGTLKSGRRGKNVISRKPIDLSHRGLSHRLEVVLDFLGDLIDGETRGRLARRANELRLSGVK